MSAPEPARLGWVIVYVPDVQAALSFYGEAFGLVTTFVDPRGDYGQLDTGTTSLAFASESLGRSNFTEGFRPGDPTGLPANVEVALVFDDVGAAYHHALRSGCTPLAPPAVKPHGQTVAWVRDPFGTLLELCSPIG